MYHSSRDPDQLVSHGLDVTTKFSVCITLHLTRPLTLSPVPPAFSCAPISSGHLPEISNGLPVCAFKLYLFLHLTPAMYTLRDHLYSFHLPLRRSKTLVLCIGRQKNIQYNTFVYSKTFLETVFKIKTRNVFFSM